MSRSSNNGGGGPCGACKFLRRKCVKDCVFASYFDAEQGPAHFAAVHKVFGASNASKLLIHVPVHRRLDAVVTLCYEALARVRDPVYGCVAHIFSLQQQVMSLQMELASVQARLYTIQRLSPNIAPTIPRTSFQDITLSPSNMLMPLEPSQTTSFFFSDQGVISSVDLNKILDYGDLIL